MKNQTITTSLNFTSDVSGALAGLKQLRQEMGNLTTDQSIFGNVDKEFAKIQKSMNELQAHEPFRNTQKGGAQYNKILDNIIVSAGKISAELKEIGKNSDGSFKFQALQQAQTKLEGMLSELTRVQNQIKDTKKELGSSLKGMGMNKELANQVKTEEDLVKILEIELQRRKEIYEQLIKERTQKAQDKASSAATLSSTEIQNAGSKYNTADKSGSGLTAAAKSLSSLIGKEMSEGIDKGRKFEEVWAQINKIIKDSGVTLVDIDAYQAKLSKEYQSAEVSAKKVSEKITEAEASMLQLGTRTEDGKVKLNEAAINAGKLAGEISGATSKEAQLGTSIASLTSEIEKQTLVEQNNLNQTIMKTDELNRKVQEEINKEKELTVELGNQTKQQDALDKQMQNMQNWITRILSLTNGWRQFRRIIQKTFQDVQKLDKAFASIAMVTDKTVAGLWETYSEYAEMANKLGQSTESAIKASALFYQQGLDTADALSLTEQTMKLATLAGADFETATQQMTAALRGFHMEMDQGAHVTDVYSELAAHAAADVNGIAYAMSKTASIASSAGMDFETTAAFLTNMIETTQEAPENIGTAMKTIIARFTELKENVSAANSEFDDLDYNKVDKALKSIGISIKDAQGQFRNLDDVFLELSSRWDTLDRNTQRYIATIAAGSRQQSRFIAMMEDYDRTIELVETAQNSAGRSSEQFAKYQDTVEYKLNQLKNAWEQLRVGMVDSDIFKGALESLTKFVQGISKIDFKKLLFATPMIIPLVKSFAQTFIQGVQSSAASFQKIGQVVSEKIGQGLMKSSKKFAGADSLVGKSSEIKEKQQEIDRLARGVENLTNLKQRSSNQKMFANESIQAYTAEIEKTRDEILQLQSAEDQDAQKIQEKKNYIQELIQKRAEMINQLGEAEFEEKTYDSVLEQQNATLQKNIEEQDKRIQTYEKSKQVIEGASQGIANGLRTVGSAATVAVTALLAGADAGQAMKALAASLTIQATQMAIQFGAMVIAQKLSNKQRVADAAKTEGEITAIQETGGAVRTSLAAKEGFLSGLLYGEGIDAGLASTGVGLIIVAIAAAIAATTLGLIALGKKVKETNKTVSEQLEEAENKLKELESNENEKVNAAKEAKDTSKNAEDLLNKYEELNKKIAKTTEEQEEWTKLIADINEQFPEIVSSYDEANGKITIQRDLWEDIVSLQKEAAKEAQLEASIASAATIGQKRRISRLNADKEKTDVQNKYGYSEDFIDYLTRKPREEIYNKETWVKKSAEKYGVDINSIAETLQISLDSSEGYSKLLDEMIDHNDKHWEIIDQYVENISKKADDTYTKQEKYYNELIKQNISQSLQAGGMEQGLAEFISVGAQKNKGREVSQYNLSTVMSAEEAEIQEWTISSGIAAAYVNDFQKWASLTEDQQKILKSMGYENEKAWNEARKNLADDADFISQYEEAAYIYNAEKLAQTVENNLEDYQKKYINDYMTNWSTMSATEMSMQEEYIKKYIENIKDDDARTTAYQSLKEIQEKNETALKTAKEEIAEIFNKDIEDYEDWSKEELDTYNLWIQNAMKAMGEGMGKAYAFEMDSFFEENNLSGTQRNQILSSIDFTQASGANWDEFKKDSIKKLHSIGVVGAESFFDEWAEYEKKYGNLHLSIDNLEELEEYLDQIKKEFDDLWGKEDKITDFASKAYLGDTIDLDEYDELAEILKAMGKDISHFTEINEEGEITLKNGEELQRIYNEQLKIKIDELKTQKELNKEELEQTKIKLQNLEITKQNRLASLGASGATYHEIQNARTKMDSEIEGLRSQISDSEDVLAELDVAIANAERSYNARVQQTINDTKKKIEEGTKKVTDEADKAAESFESAQEKVKDALEKIVKAEQDVIDKTKELNEVLYGEEFHKNKLDSLYNYTTALNQFTKEASRAKEALESSKAGDNVQELMNSYLENSHGELVNRRAQNEVISASISNYQSILTSKLATELSNINTQHGSNISTNVSDYVYKNGNRLGVNFQALNAAKLPDSISDYVEETIETINKLQDQIDDNTDAIRKKEQELLQMRKSALERRKSLEDDIVKVLQDNAKKEVDIQKDKYDAMKTADDEYLDALEKAINKERELRERNNKWNDLATKEKKLSLMQRDTSGANAKEVMDLEQEVQNDRQQMLDDSIDEIIDNMREMYELQQESREIELEYQEAMLDSTEWIKQATNIVEGWKTSDDMVQWFVQNATEEFTQGSETTREIMTMKWQETGDQMVADTEILGANMEDIANITSQEVSTTIVNTSETLTTEADTSLKTIVNSTNDAIAKGEQALNDAIKSVQAARDDYTKAVADLEQQRRDLAAAQEEVAQKERIKEQTEEYIKELNRIYSDKRSGAGMAITEMLNGIGEEYSSHITFDNDSKQYKYKYASGGLVNYTGPAWVDGTPNEPEAFLSAEDTKRIGAAANLLASLPFFNNSSIDNSVNNGDSLIEVHINIENISSDVDLDNALDRMKTAIWEAANPTGSSVILSK